MRMWLVLALLLCWSGAAAAQVAGRVTGPVLAKLAARLHRYSEWVVEPRAR